MTEANKTGAIEKPRRRARTAPLPGTEDTRLEDVRDAALAYVDVRDQRVALTAKETEAREKLLAAMKTHRLRKYRDAESGILAEIVVTQEKVKVYLDKKDDDEGGG